MISARKLARPALAALVAAAVGASLPAAEALAQPAHALKKKRKKPTRGQCTVWANYKRPDLKIHANGARWDEIAKSRGFPVDSTPRVGDIAVWEANFQGAFSTGHVAYVTKVSKGKISVSEFNWGSARERYGTRSGISPKGLKFIHRKP